MSETPNICPKIDQQHKITHFNNPLVQRSATLNLWCISTLSSNL